MSEECGKCGSTNLEARDHDLWHYMRNCKDCGARTRYNSKGKVVWVKGGDASVKKSSDNIFTGLPNKEYYMSNKIVGHLVGLGSIKSIVDSLGRNKGTIDSFGNIKDSFGRITGHVDSYGNIKDSFGNIKGSIDSFGNVHES